MRRARALTTSTGLFCDAADASTEGVTLMVGTFEDDVEASTAVGSLASWLEADALLCQKEPTIKPQVEPTKKI
jgi:hypothetical protein